MTWTQEPHPQTGELPTRYDVWWGPDGPIDFTNPETKLVEDATNLPGGASGSATHTTTGTHLHCFTVGATWENFGTFYSNTKCKALTPEIFCNNMTIDELLVAFPSANIFDNRGGASTIMIGTPDADLMLAGNNGDELRGEGGDDCIIGGDVDDLLIGSFGNDQIYGNDGNDTLRANSGDDFLDSGAGADTLNAGIGLDTCITDQFDWWIHSCES